MFSGCDKLIIKEIMIIIVITTTTIIPRPRTTTRFLKRI
jgi:hypothetical protein